MNRRRTFGSPEVEEYLANVPDEFREALERLRKTIRAAAPNADEVLSYRIPAFRQNGILVYYAAFKDHCSFFPGSTAARLKFAVELKPFRAGKGTFQFTLQRPIPATLVKRIVRARLAENRSLASKKRASAGRPSDRHPKVRRDSRRRPVRRRGKRASESESE